MGALTLLLVLEVLADSRYVRMDSLLVLIDLDVISFLARRLVYLKIGKISFKFDRLKLNNN